MGFKDKFSKTMNAAADKSAELAGMAKIKLDITNKKTSIKKNYSHLGEVVYNASLSGTDISDEIKKICDEINVFTREVADLEASLEK